MPHRLDEARARDAARTAAITGRLRVSRRAESQLEDEGRPVPHVEHAMRTATGAESIEPPECWRLTGGTSLDGERLVVEIEIEESVVRVLSVTTER